MTRSSAQNAHQPQAAGRSRGSRFAGAAPSSWAAAALTLLLALPLAGCIPLVQAGQLVGAAAPDPAEPVVAAGRARPAPQPDVIPVAGPANTDEVRLTDTGLIDLHVRDVDIAAVLEMISYEAHANIVSTSSVSGRISANLYGVTLERALEAVLTPNHYAFQVSGNTIYVGKSDELAVLQPAPITRVFRLRYLKPAEAAAAVKAVLATDAVIVEGGATEEGAASGGTGGSAGGDSGGSTDMGAAAADYIVVTDRPDRLDAAEKLLADIDRKPDQVLVEATVLRATLNESNQLGIDFTILCGVDFRNVNSLSAAGANLTTGQLPAAEFEDTTVNVNTDFAANVADGGFTFGIIHNNVAAFIRALETVTDVVVVANPKVVALNKQEGEVIVGRRDGYLTTLVTETAAIQKVDFLETGTQIRFRPLVLDDGTVRLVVHPKDSNGGLTAANLPFEETTEAHADVLVPDGGTVLIGGLFRERTISGRSQIPGIGNIPLLGLLFGSVNDATTREEVIILLTVHIVRNTPQELDAYRELLEDVERIRVGSRRGLLGTGRERLAQAHYHEALRNLERGQDDLALLNLRMTLNNQPKHTPAIKLRDSLLQRRTWDDDGSRMRTFIHELIDPHGRKLDREVFGRPAPELLIEPPEPPPENPPEPLVPPPAPRPEATGGAP